MVGTGTDDSEIPFEDGLPPVLGPDYLWPYTLPELGYEIRMRHEWEEDIHTDEQLRTWRPAFPEDLDREDGWTLFGKWFLSIGPEPHEDDGSTADTVATAVWGRKARARTISALRPA